MIKKILLACLCSLLLLPILLSAQSPKIVRSEPFEEPADGASKLLLLKNGKTMFFHFTRKRGIEVVVYDNKHKASPMEHNHVASWTARKMGDTYLSGLFEINGQGGRVSLAQFKK